MPGGPPARCLAPGSTDPTEAPKPRTQFSLGAGWLDTTLDFGDLRADVEMTAVSLSASRPLGDKWTGRFSIGAVVDGSVQPHGGPAHTVKPGGLIAVGFERHLRNTDGASPAVDLTGALGVTWAKTEAPGSDVRTSYTAADLRLGARATWQLGAKIFPFAAGRVFGGPVNWELAGDNLSGTDIHHYQLAVGVAALVGKTALFAEWAGVGERGLSAGIGTAW